MITTAAPVGDPTVRGALAALDVAGVTWLLLRDPRSVDDPDAGDVDLLVDPSDIGRLGEVLRARSYVPVRLLGRGSHRAFVALDPASGRFRWIDVVTRLELGPWLERPLPYAPDLLRRRVLEDGLWRPAPTDAFWSLALHALLDKPAVPVRHRLALADLVDAAEPSDGWGAAIPTRTRGAIVAAVAARDWERLDVLGRTLRMSVPRRARPWRAVLVATRRVLRRVEPVVAGRARAGLTVALVGPDGAGKSTVAAAVAARYPFPAAIRYLGLWQGASAARRWWPGGELAGRVLTAWRGWGGGRLLRARGWLVLFDRYPYDARLRTGTGGPWRSRAYFGLIGASCPPPDLLLVLDAPAATLRARKPEHAIDEIERDRAGFRRLLARHRNARLVDAEQPLEGLEREVLRAVWAEVVSRWPR